MSCYSSTLEEVLGYDFADNEDMLDVARIANETALYLLRELGRMCITEKGYIGLVASSTLVGDVVAIFPGAAVPFILRILDDKNDKVRMVGESYIHGIMTGEVVKMPDIRVKRVIIV